jgi:serine/threonine protein kinase
VHRDLKPDNVLLPGKRAIVVDFGIARILDSTTKLTGTGALIGTPHYMAPEQIEGTAAGNPADAWSLGATLYTAVEGVPPFDGPTLTATLAGILTRPPRPAEHAGPLWPLLIGLLSKDPARRPDARAAARALAAPTLAAPPADGPTATVQTPLGTLVPGIPGWRSPVPRVGALPIANYDKMSIASLRARLRNLSGEQLLQLIDYERTHANRTEVIAMFARRLSALQSE